MMKAQEGVLRSSHGETQSPGQQDALSAWQFRWVQGGAPEQRAHVTGQLRWRGFDLGFAVDGLLGVDGRLCAQGIASMPPHLQQLVLQHFADECLSPLKSSALGELTILSLHWHEEPVPMLGEFEFTFKRTELLHASRGRLTVPQSQGRVQFINALASLQWPVPSGLAVVKGHLRIGSVSLTAQELASLEVGDLVWLDDAEVSPLGLRAQFIQAQSADESCWIWIKRSSMRRQDAVADVADLSDADPDGVLTLYATSPQITVQRAWLQGAMPQQSLAQTALAMTWLLEQGERVRFEGGLIVIGRRLGLRVTRVL
jgi:hypothetical protein